MSVAVSFAALPAAAQAAPEAVLVLEAPDLGWKPGVQALVAELLTRGYELSVRSSGARSLEELEPELRREVADSGAAAGVSVMREGTSATALLCRSGDGACARVRIDATDGELSRSRLALAIVERLRPLELPAAPPTEPLAARAVPAPAAPPPRPPAVIPRERPFRAWLGGGLLLSSGLSTPMGWLSSSLDVSASAPWGFEVALAGAPLAGRAQTYAGSLSVRGLQAAAFATFEPLRRQAWGFDLGLGGGVLHIGERATPASGFDGFSESTTVGVVSARARVYRRFGSVYWGLAVDPGMLVPAVSVEAGAERLLRIGRPWLALQSSLGVDL